MFRNALFGITGYRHFGKNGFEKCKAEWSKREPSCDIPQSLKGKSFMVTGANSGLGKAAALELAKRGAKVHIICRNKERGEAAREEMIQTTGNPEVILHVVDLSLMSNIKSFAKEFLQSQEPLDVLINNAGLLVDKFEKTSEGLESSIATNLYGSFLLTELLLPLLNSTGEKGSSSTSQPHDFSRVVNVASGGMLTQKLNVSDPTLEHMDPFDGVAAYAQAKRGQVYLAELWAQRKSEDFPFVKYYSMHPGWADTPGVEKSLPSFHQRFKSMLRSPAEGADTMVWLATTHAPEVLGSQGNGAFFFDREIARQHLPLCWTESSKEDLEKFWQNCRTYSHLDS